jgi:hypothetical protein
MISLNGPERSRKYATISGMRRLFWLLFLTVITGANLPAQSSVARTGQANTFSTGLQDLSGATLKIPTASGFTASANSMFGFDSATNFPHIFYGGANKTFGTAAFQGTSAFQAPLTDYATIAALPNYPGALATTAQLTYNNHLLFSGSAPTLSVCGTSPSTATGAVDNAGTINVGSGVVTACTLTFAVAFTNAPACTLSDNSATVTGDVTSVSTTAVVFGLSATLGSGKIFYHCF